MCLTLYLAKVGGVLPKQLITYGGGSVWRIKLW